MVWTRKRAYAQYHCGRAHRWKISLGSYQPGRGGNERVRRIPGTRSGKEDCLHLKWDDDETWENRTSVVTVELSESGGGTELRLTHEQLPSEESRDRQSEGWNSLLDRLAQFISK